MATDSIGISILTTPGRNEVYKGQAELRIYVSAFMGGHTADLVERDGLYEGIKEGISKGFHIKGQVLRVKNGTTSMYFRYAAKDNSFYFYGKSSIGEGM